MPNIGNDSFGQSSAQDSSQLYSVLEYFKAHVTAIVTLATGTLVLSISFIKDVDVTTLQRRGFLQAGWILFTISIVAGVCYSYILTLIAKDPKLRQTFKQMLGAISFVLHFAFMFGVVCFLVFALANVNMKKSDKATSSPTPSPTATSGN